MLGSGWTSLGAALSGYDGANTGQSVFTISGNGAGVDDLAFTTSTGDSFPAYDPDADEFNNGTATTLAAVDGGEIRLFSDAMSNDIVYGVDEDGHIVFAVYLEAGTDNLSAKIWTVQFEPIAHTDPQSTDEAVDLTDVLYVSASRDLTFSLQDAPSGQNLFIMFGDGEITEGESEIGIIATGRSPANTSQGEAVNSGDTVNTSQAAGANTFGVNNQMINEGEGLYFTFVTNPHPDYTVPNLSATEANLESNMVFS
ncbi:MAG: hypothetical protein LPK02_12435, partial [Rhodobacterales bacterium]|nr:hypothetical protein [Rhodobacterales bacterium]